MSIDSQSPVAVASPLYYACEVTWFLPGIKLVYDGFRLFKKSKASALFIMTELPESLGELKGFWVLPIRLSSLGTGGLGSKELVLALLDTFCEANFSSTPSSGLIFSSFRVFVTNVGDLKLSAVFVLLPCPALFDDP